MLKKYQSCKDRYCAINAPEAHYIFELLEDSFDNSVYHKLEREIENRIEVCKKIVNIFSVAIQNESAM